MTNLDPSLPGQHADLIDGKGKATPWFRRWLERTDTARARIEAIATGAAAAAAAIPAAVASPAILGINGIDVSGSATTDWTISGAALQAQAQAGASGVPGRDGVDGEDSWIPGPTGLTGPTGPSGPTGPNPTIIYEDHYEENAWTQIPGPAGAAGTSGGQSAIQFKDEGVSIGSSGAITSVDFVGAGVVATVVGTAATVTIAGGGGSGAMTLVGTSTVAGAAAISITLSGLNLAADGRYFMEFVLKNGAASLTDLLLYFNGDTTNANYDTEQTHFNGASVSGARYNIPYFGDILAGDNCSGWMWIQNNFDLKPSATGQHRSDTTTSIQHWLNATMWRTAANVTSITVSGDVASCFAIGSFIKVWKLT